MIKKTITYDDLDGNPITEDFYFHVSRSDLTRMELSANGGLAESLQRLVASNKGAKIVAEFERIILGSYGIRGEDGKRFRKSREISQDFKDTDAYDKLFMELVSDPKASEEFITGILPAGLQEIQDKPTGPPTPVGGNVFDNNDHTPTTKLGYSAVDLLSMTPEEFAKAQEAARQQG